MRRAGLPLCVILSALVAWTAAPSAELPVFEAKLLAGDGDPGDRFGRSVAVFGDTAIVSAAENYTGVAYVFEHSGGQWLETQRLYGAPSADGDRFGWSVALYKNTTLIGASNDGTNGTEAGAAYVFVRSEGLWTQRAKLLPADGDASDWFGVSVALQYDTALIGASRASVGGSVYVFVRSGGVWTQHAKLQAADGDDGDRFGASVALDGDTALIGASWDEENGFRSGSAYVFTRSGGVWTQQAKLLPPDGAEYDHFGQRVALEGDTAFVTAPGHPVTELTTGSAYVYTRAAGVWSEQVKLVPADGALGDGFGWSVTVEKDTAAVGSFAADGAAGGSGSAYLFTRTGGVWGDQTEFVAPDGAFGDSFGESAALGQGALVIGAVGDDDNGSAAGSAYVFRVPYEPDDDVPDVPATGVASTALLLLAVLATGAWLGRTTRAGSG